MKLEKEEEMGNSPVNLGIFEAQHQTKCNRIVFNARGGHLGIFWVGMCRPGLQIGTPY